MQHKWQILNCRSLAVCLSFRKKERHLRLICCQLRFVPFHNWLDMRQCVKMSHTGFCCFCVFAPLCILSQIAAQCVSESQCPYIRNTVIDICIRLTLLLLLPLFVVIIFCCCRRHCMYTPIVCVHVILHIQEYIAVCP